MHVAAMLDCYVHCPNYDVTGGKSATTQKALAGKMTAFKGNTQSISTLNTRQTKSQTTSMLLMSVVLN